MPIMLVGEKRSSQASVASDFADKDYCSSKGTFFYGVKFHIVGERRRGTMPLPERVGLTPGSENDLVTLCRVLPEVRGSEPYGDKAYCDGPMKEYLCKEQNLKVFTPIKKKKGQKRLSAADRLLSEAVSRVRQPIGLCSTGLRRKNASCAPTASALQRGAARGTWQAWR